MAPSGMGTPAALLSLTQDINRSSRLVRNRSEGLGSLWPYHPERARSCLRGWEELPHCPTLPLTYTWACTVRCGAEESISGLQVKRGCPAGPDHTDTCCSWVLLGTDTEKQVCSWLENPSDTADAKQKERVLLCSWSATGRMDSAPVLQSPPEKPRRFLHWTSARWWFSVLGRRMAWNTSESISTCRGSLHPFTVNDNLTFLDPLGLDWILQLYSLRGPSAPLSQHWPCFVTTHIVLLTAFSLGVQGSTVPQHLVWPLVHSRGPTQMCYWWGRTMGGADILFFKKMNGLP